MKLFFLLFICLIQNLLINGEIDCNRYSNDLQIINLNPFYIYLFSLNDITSVNYNTTINQVLSFNIINDFNPSSNIYCLKNVETIKLKNTNLTILPDIKNLQQLISLSIETDNGIIEQHLPSEIGQLKSLSILSLIDIKNLEDLPNEIEYLTELTILILKKIPNFINLPDESISKLINLIRLNLIDLPQLSNIPTAINRFQQLKELILENIHISTLQLDSLNNLSNCNISSNSILKTIEILNMPLLSLLNIQNNNELITLKIKNLPSLKSFISSSNTKLEVITINNLSQLSNFNGSLFPSLKDIIFLNTPLITNLSLSKCQLKIFPQNILTLKSLEYLFLPYNQLSSLPITLENDLPNLKILDLTGNLFQDTIILPPLINLQELYLSNNALISFNGIENYKSLKKLELHYNNISSIPIEIMELSPTLQIMGINYNQLHTIPYQMTNMRSLKELSATNNNILLFEKQNLVKVFRSSNIKLSLN